MKRITLLTISLLVFPLLFAGQEQRSRVFYRREPETVPLVIAKPETNP